MDDLFEHEQRILDQASAYLEEVGADGACPAEVYAVLVKEYGRLLRQIRRITRISDRTAEELNASKLTLMERVSVDALTGIYNRSFLRDQLPRIAETLAAGGKSLGLLMIDVDFFKRYNDTYGHGMGDDCLRMVAERLRECAEEKRGFAARYGGEEFVIALPEAGEPETRAVAEAVLDRVRACSIEHLGNDAARCVTVSVGATACQAGAWSCRALLQRADKAMYCSKQGGRNRYTFFRMGE